MPRNILIAALAGVLLTLGITAEQPVPHTFTQIDYPGASVTGAFGVNVHRDVVGFYADSAGTHGFLLSDGNFSPIDYPGAKITQARGINNRGDIVGTYQMEPKLPGGDFHGFLLRKGIFTKVDYPAPPGQHLNTIAQRITDSGEIVGCYHGGDFMASMHGMVGEDGHYRALDGTYHALNVPASMNNGATSEAVVIAGFYMDMMNETHGYVIHRDNFAAFDFPHSLSTQAWDINASENIVGFYSDAAGKIHGYELGDDHRSYSGETGERSTGEAKVEQDSNVGFVFDENDFVSIDYPGATWTRAFGINTQGDVVGQFADSAGKQHAFLLNGARYGDD